MKKQCQYCQTEFIPVRNSKKFCSDRCKQLAHYARKGIEYLGRNPDQSNLGQNEITAPTLKSENENEELLLTLSDKAAPSIDLENDKIECLSLNDTDVSALNDKENLIADNLITENISREQKLPKNDKQALPLNVKEGSMNDSVLNVNKLTERQLPKNDKEITVEREQALIEKPIKPKSTYRWVMSKFLFDISDYVTKNCLIELRFQVWRNSTSKEYIKEEIWVSLRFKCLVESLLRLSEIKRVDYPTITAVSRAFTTLLNSWQFNCLVDKTYPYKDLIRELEDKMKKYVAATRAGEEILFKMSREKKIQLIATRHLIGDFVPSIEFSELDFE